MKKGKLSHHSDATEEFDKIPYPRLWVFLLGYLDSTATAVVTLHDGTEVSRECQSKKMSLLSCHSA